MGLPRDDGPPPDPAGTALTRYTSPPGAKMYGGASLATKQNQQETAKRKKLEAKLWEDGKKAKRRRLYEILGGDGTGEDPGSRSSASTGAIAPVGLSGENMDAGKWHVPHIVPPI